jgi:hypothetical protein
MARRSGSEAVRRLAALALAVALLAPAANVRAEQWGAMVPGESTMDAVRALRGQPTRTTTEKVEGYDTAQWVYEAVQAPTGITRLTIDFGLKTASGYRPELVRSFKHEPRPGVFDRGLVLVGWGPPAGVGRDGEVEFIFYKEGLFVYFAPQDNSHVTSMVFTPPQLPPAPAEPRP